MKELIQEEIAYILTASICNTDLSVLEWVQNKLNCGKIYKHSQYKGRLAFRWITKFNDARYVLDILYPFFKIKQAQAALGIMFQEFLVRKRNLGGKGLAKSEFQMREQFSRRISELNHGK